MNDIVFLIQNRTSGVRHGHESWHSRRSLLRPPVRTFEVVMRRNTFLRYLSYSSPRILNPFLRAATTNRAVAIDCGMLAAMEAKEGPPKGYMADEAVQKKQTRRLAECSFKTKLETGKFTSGCLSEKVNHQATHNGDTGEMANLFLACLSHHQLRHGLGHCLVKREKSKMG